MKKLTDLLKEARVDIGRLYTAKDKPPFKVNEIKTSKLIGTPKKQFGSIYKMKEDMKEGKFDPQNPQVLIHGFGVYNLKTLEKVIARDLKDCISGGAEYAAQKLYTRHSVTESKIKAANDVYQQMETSQYKRAVTMYKKRR